MTQMGIDDSLDRALAGADAVYVAFDLDVLDPGEADVFMPEPDGMSVAVAEDLLREVASRATVAGVGVTGLVQSDDNTRVISGLLAALGL
jgi:arginase family enzyme